MYGWPRRYTDLVGAQLNPALRAAKNDYGAALAQVRARFGRRLRQDTEKWRTVQRILLEQEMFFLCLRPSPAAEVHRVVSAYERVGFQNVRQRIALASYLSEWAKRVPGEGPWVAQFVQDAERRFTQMPGGHPKRELAAKVLGAIQERLASVGAWPPPRPNSADAGNGPASPFANTP